MLMISTTAQTPQIWEDTKEHVLLPYPLLASCSSCDLGGWGFSALPLPPARSWEYLQNSPRPGISGLSETMAKLLSAPYLPITPLFKKQRLALESVRHCQSLDAMKLEKGVAAIPGPVLLWFYNKQATLLLFVFLLKWVGFFLQAAVQWDTGHPKLFVMFLG